MRGARILASTVLAGTFFALTLPTPVRGDTKIFQYDEYGRLKTVKQLDHGQDKKNRGASKRQGPKDRAAAARAKSAGKLLEWRTVPNPRDRFERNELVVMGPRTGFAKRVAALNFTVLERVPLAALDTQMLRLRPPRGMSESAALKLLRTRFPGIVADFNALFDLSQGAPGSVGASDYALALVGWGRVPRSCGRNIRLGMIDTLPDLRHPMLKGQRIVAFNFVPKDRRPAVADHGTGIAGLLVGRPFRGNPGGLLPGAQLFAGGIFERRRDGKPRGNLLAFVKAVNWLARNKVRAVNLSIAGSNNKVLEEVAKRSLKAGMVLVAAAGNGGPQAPPAYPAAYRNVVSVTALDGRKQIYRYANRGSYIDFAAPGVALWTASRSGGRLQSGTSFAVPFITSLVALLLEGGSPAAPDRLRRQLRRYSQDLGAKGRDSTFGYGLVRVRPSC